MACFISHSGVFLPGDPVGNDDIEKYMGKIWFESKIKSKILAANKIKERYYALDQSQNPTHDAYDMALEAIRECLKDLDDKSGISYLSSGTTKAPLIGPGMGSILHGRLSEEKIITQPLEINSNSGICTSAAQALVNAYRAVEYDGHKKALCVGSENPTEILRSSVLKPPYDLVQMYKEIKESKWFMTVFLRFMLSDGAGAFLLQNEAAEGKINYKVDWTFSQSFANQAPLCMKLESKNMLLSQDIRILSKNLGPCVSEFINNAMARHDENLSNYDCLLPHISSYFFIRTLKNVLRQQLDKKDQEPEYWTNLDTKGNTGSASIFIMLDEYTKTRNPQPGSRVLLFVPESGQFNFVLVSLTVV